MRPSPALSGLILLLASSLPARAADQARCEGRPEIAGQCFTVHGRLSDWNGNPTLRIWKIGTKRMLGVREGYALPENIRACVGWDRFRKLYGDFLVCPLAPERAGHMRPVCVEAASRIQVEVFEDYESGKAVAAYPLGDRACTLE